MANPQFSVTFYGVRGTMPMASRSHLGVGGNTSCVGVMCGKRQLVFDAGSGLFPLGEQTAAKDIDIFLSHTHIDHILGVPFFSPAFNENSTIRFWAGHLLPDYRLVDVLSRIVSPPIFPLTFADFKADLSFHDFMAGEPVPAVHLKQDGIRVSTLPLFHPDRATAYRVDFEGKSVCYVTDVEHCNDEFDQNLVNFIRNSDLFIYDSTFDDAAFAKYAGWGHSTWQHAIRLGEKAKVKQVALFHHDPGADDALLNQRENVAKTMRSGTFIAREGMTVGL
ncbi:MAG: MBL fold metallo-hydrolase [Rickettsiales bacterium]